MLLGFAGLFLQALDARLAASALVIVVVVVVIAFVSFDSVRAVICPPWMPLATTVSPCFVGPMCLVVVYLSGSRLSIITPLSERALRLASVAHSNGILDMLLEITKHFVEIFGITMRSVLAFRHLIAGNGIHEILASSAAIA